MVKYLVPLFLFAVAGFVWHYNQTHTGSFMLLPLIDGIPSLRGDLPAQATWSWRIIAGIGILVLVINLMTEKWKRDI